MYTEDILTVTQLNGQVKYFLEQELGFLSVKGEVSNLSKPSSGHYYFTLKDAHAQLRCVFFKNRQIPQTAPLQEGQEIVAKGRLSLYEARGDYQLIVEQISDAGLGALYQQFEALKKKLALEGLFDPCRKKTIPSMPRTIGVITSPHGAALRDILSTLNRRFPLAVVRIYPSEVQGSTAAKQLIQALEQAIQEQRCEVLILARGGGSIEDLWAFNDEKLARCIAQSNIPIVSGVGHETDFTIADFVADYRAETPTAAANKVSPDRMELLKRLSQMLWRLEAAMMTCFQKYQFKINQLSSRLSSPYQIILTYWQKTDYLERQLIAQMNHLVQNNSHHLRLCETHLHTKNPKTLLSEKQRYLKQLRLALNQMLQVNLRMRQQRIQTALSTLEAVSPLATLNRGYAIALYDGKVLRRAQDVALGDMLEVRLAHGSLLCQIRQRTQADD